MPEMKTWTVGETTYEIVDEKAREAINEINTARENGEFKGEKGDTGGTGPQGPAGADGYTPVKGVDYFTESDKAEIVSSVLVALPTWNGGSY